MIRHLCPVPGGMGVPPWGCTGPVHWLMHVNGIDSQVSYFYDFMSGPGPFYMALSGWLVIAAGVVTWYRHWNCHARWSCLRHAKHALTDPDTGETHHLCWKHHPGQRHKHWKRHHIEDVWRRHLARQRATE